MRVYSSMPLPLADLHRLLWADLALLYQRWNTFQALYTDQDVVDLLNWAAAGFFRLHQRVLLDDVLLGLARLGDRPESGGQANLVLRSLVPRVPSELTELTGSIEEALIDYDKRVDFARPIRHKRLAHRDHEEAAGLGSTLDYRYEDADIKAALASAANVLNLIDSHFESRTTLFEQFIEFRGAELLLARLRSAKRLQELESTLRLDPSSQF